MGPRGPSAVKMAVPPALDDVPQPQQTLRARRANSSRAPRQSRTAPECAVINSPSKLRLMRMVARSGGNKPCRAKRTGARSRRSPHPHRLAFEQRGHAFLGDDLKAPGAADQPQQRPHHARDHGQHKALGECESGAGTGGHCFDSSWNSRFSWNPARFSWDAARSQVREATPSAISIWEACKKNGTKVPT
jgi:hypothetical protein